MSGPAVTSAIIMDVFSAFPGAVVSDRFVLGRCQRGSLEGNQFVKVADVDAIIDEGDMGEIGGAPNAEALIADIILYVKPEQLPTGNPRELTAGYMVYDVLYGGYFAITDAGIGKNQDNGMIEHIELKLRQTDVLSALEPES